MLVVSVCLFKRFLLVCDCICLSQFVSVCVHLLVCCAKSLVHCLHNMHFGCRCRLVSEVSVFVKADASDVCHRASSFQTCNTEQFLRVSNIEIHSTYLWAIMPWMKFMWTLGPSPDLGSCDNS